MHGIDSEQSGHYHGKCQDDLLRQTERSKRKSRQETPPIYDRHISGCPILHNISGRQLGTNTGDVDYTINHYGGGEFPEEGPLQCRDTHSLLGLVGSPPDALEPAPHRMRAHNRPLRVDWEAPVLKSRRGPPAPALRGIPETSQPREIEGLAP
jgi:hypothetical protein